MFGAEVFKIAGESFVQPADENSFLQMPESFRDQHRLKHPHPPAHSHPHRLARTHRQARRAQRTPQPPLPHRLKHPHPTSPPPFTFFCTDSSYRFLYFTILTCIGVVICCVIYFIFPLILPKTFTITIK